MTQTRTQSLFESLTNIAIGLVTSVIANALVFPLFGFHPKGVQNVEITAIYTLISFVRSYSIRRM